MCTTNGVLRKITVVISRIVLVLLGVNNNPDRMGGIVHADPSAYRAHYETRDNGLTREVVLRPLGLRSPFEFFSPLTPFDLMVSVCVQVLPHLTLNTHV